MYLAHTLLRAAEFSRRPAGTRYADKKEKNTAIDS